MSLKEDAKATITALIGPVNGDKVDNFDDSDPVKFLDQCKDVIAEILGDSIAQAKLQHLYDGINK